MKEFFLYPICKFLDLFMPAGSQKSLPVLMYHSIRDSDSPLSIAPDEFARQMEYLFRKGYKTILPQDLLGKDLFFDRRVMITFDDGFNDNYAVALPVLKKYNFTAVVFIITRYINSPGKLAPKEIESLEENGWIIANHFDSHRDLTGLNSEEIVCEFEIAREKLGNVCAGKKAANIVSYPHSRYNENVIAAVKKAGAEMAFNGGNRYFRAGDNFFVIPRVEISKRVSFLKFKLILSPSFDLLRRIFHVGNC